MKPKVSVVVPAFNAQRFIERAVRSATQQTLPPWEVIVVNDGSTDATAALARQIGHPVCVIDRENGGLSVARNTGILAARGELIALLDADDSWKPTKLEKQVAFLERDSSMLACFSATEYVTASGERQGESKPPHYQDLVEDLLLHSCVMGPPSAAMIRREAFAAVGLFDPRLSQCADWDMWLRLAERGRMGFLPEVLVSYERHEGNMSRNISLLEADTREVLSKFFAVHRPRYARLRRRSSSNHWLILAGSYYHASQPRHAYRCALRALATDPRAVLRLLKKLPALRVRPATKTGTP